MIRHHPCLSTPLFRPVDRPALSLSPSLSSVPEISPSIFVKVDPYFGPRSWPLAAGRGLARDGYIWAPWERTATRWGSRRGSARAKQKRGVAGERGGRKLADESRSGSTRGKVVVRDQPSATAAIVRLFLSSLHPFASSSLLFFFLSRLPFSSSSRSDPSGYSRFSRLFFLA